MAGISTTIRVVDGLTAPVQRMASAVDRLCGGLGDAGDSVEEFADDTNKVANSVNKVNDSANTLGSTITKLIGIIGGLSAIKGIIGVSDEMVSITARLDMMNDGLQTTEELQNMIYQSAQRARGSYSDLSTVVAKFGNNAKDAFNSSAEVVAFSEIVQKQMTIAGASSTEASNAILQLSQALGSGVLRGDELNSIFEQAPNLIQSIADYLEVPIGEIRSMASEGQLSASVVKAAVFNSADEVNAKIEQMPMTFEQAWTRFKNTALMAFQPVLDRLNDIVNSDSFQQFTSTAINALHMLSNVALDVMEGIGNAVEWVRERWEVLSPYIYTAVGAFLAYNAVMTAVTTAQAVLNAVMSASPLTWIVLGVIALISAIVLLANHLNNVMGLAGSTFGVICGWISVVAAAFKNALVFAGNMLAGFVNAGSAVATNLRIAFGNAISSVQGFFYDLASTAAGVIASIAEALNTLPFVEFDYSGITAKAEEWAQKSEEAYDSKEDYLDVGAAWDEGASFFGEAFADGWAEDAFNAGAAWGDGITDKVTSALEDLTTVDTEGFGSWDDAYGDIAADTGSIADSTGKAAKSLDITSEDLKYLREIAERDVINRFTTAEIKVDMVNNNSVSNGYDIDSMINQLYLGVSEAMETAREGVA